MRKKLKRVYRKLENLNENEFAGEIIILKKAIKEIESLEKIVYRYEKKEERTLFNSNINVKL